MDREVVQPREKQKYIDSDTRGHGGTKSINNKCQCTTTGSDKRTTPPQMPASSEDIAWTKHPSPIPG